jgi:hypothetical protein
MTHDGYDELLMLVGSIDAKLDVALDQLTDHGKRITSLERSRTWLSGAVGSLTAVVVWFTHDRLPQLIALIH